MFGAEKKEVFWLLVWRMAELSELMISTYRLVVTYLNLLVRIPKRGSSLARFNCAPQVEKVRGSRWRISKCSIRRATQPAPNARSAEPPARLETSWLEKTSS